jgi:hypothetical protein
MAGMVTGQTNTFPTEPIAYSLPVSDNIIESLKVEGWRQADIEPGLEKWIWQVTLRNPNLGQDPPPVELSYHGGIRSGKIYFLVNDQQLATIHRQGLVYRLQPEERGQFTAVVLVYESEYATVPMSAEQALIYLPSPPANLQLPAPPNSLLGTPPVDLASRMSNAKSLENLAISNSTNHLPGSNQIENRMESSSKTSAFIEKWSANGATVGESVTDSRLSSASQTGPGSQNIQVVTQEHLEKLVLQNQAEANRLAQLRLELNQERRAWHSQNSDENRAPISYPTNQFPNQYSNAAVEYSVESITDRGMATETVPQPLMKPPHRLQPTALDPSQLVANQLPSDEKTGGFDRTHGFLWFMLLSAIGLNVYLGWISRGFYVRYGELADELKDTFPSSI